MKNSTALFYARNKVSTVMMSSQNRSLFHAANNSLAEHQTHGNSLTILIAHDINRSPVRVSTSTQEEDNTYSPYGTGSLDDRLATLGFNGEFAIPFIEKYTLGNGYRNYSPNLLRLLSPDSMSPFSAGGLNSYAYCADDPVNFTDKSGHMRSATRPPIAVPVSYRSERVNTLKELTAANFKKYNLANETILTAQTRIEEAKSSMRSIDRRYQTGKHIKSSTLPETIAATEASKKILLTDIDTYKSVIADQKKYKEQLYNRTKAFHEELKLYTSENLDSVEHMINNTRQSQ